jgi:four helix bundle protein
MQDYHQLDVWNRAMAYTVQVYEFAAKLPADERYNLAAQVRRAAVSVPLNIAEGAGCEANPEFARFLGYAYRSLKEVLTCLELCQRLHPAVAQSAAEALIDEGNQISRMVHAFMQRVAMAPHGGPETGTHNS